VILVLGAGNTFAQSGSSGSSSGTTGSSGSGSTGSSTYGSGQRNNSSTGTSGSSGSTYGSGSGSSSTGANADVNSTRDINSTTGAGAMTGRDTTSGSSSGKLSWGDRRFVTKAADDGKDEVSLAQLAAQRASNTEVKNFAQKLVSDHQSVNSELTQIAGQKNVKIDTDDDKDRMYKRLSKKSGAEFDQEFVEHMIDEHEKDIKLFEKAASDAKDPDVKSFAAKHVDHLREHLQQAQGLRQTLMPTGRMDSSSGRSTSGTSGSSSYGSGSGTSGTSSSGSSNYGSGSSSSSSSPGSSSSSPSSSSGSSSGSTGGTRR